MNTIQEIHRINERELASGSKASWHDQYKDSAYIHVGGLPYNLTEGDVITICSQYGEVVDISMPRDANTQKPKGFAFVMYADQRSTVLAVDNLGGAKVLDRTLKVDHVLNYKQLERDNDTGKMKEREVQSLAAHPDQFRAPTAVAAADASDAESASSYGDIDLDDPMRDFLIEQRKAARAAGGGKRRREGETKAERKARREELRAKKAARAGKKGDGGGKRIEGGERRGEEGRRVGGGRESGERRGEEERRRERSPRREREERDRPRARDAREEERRSAYPDERDDRRARPRAEERRDDYRGDRRRDDRRDDGRGERRDDGAGGGRGGAGRAGGGGFADLERWASGK